VFFLGGALFCYKLVLPFGYEFLLKFGEDVSSPELMMQEYLGLTTKLLLAFGAIFQMPIITTVLAKIGLVNWRMMIKFWKYALVICFVVGALLTPPDVISQVLLAGPMMGLYALSVGCAFVFGKRPGAPEDEEDEEEDEEEDDVDIVESD
jgi:sec-independent protein translocase protein TatC